MNYYITDGSLDGFYTAVFYAYRDKEAYITSDIGLNLSLFDTQSSIKTDRIKANNIKNRIKQWDKEIIDDMFLLLKYSGNDREQIAYEYLKVMIREKKPVRTMFSDSAVEKATTILRKIRGEVHNFKGFIRFVENRNGVLYAPFAPDHDILELLMPHFEKRLGTTPFLIHDTKRSKIGIWNGTCHTFAKAGISPTFIPSKNQEEWENLWKSYYKHVNIELRPHEKQMKGSMPVRYWTYLPELNET